MQVKHTNKIAVYVLSKEYSDYPDYFWNYDREYQIIVEAIEIKSKKTLDTCGESFCYGECQKLLPVAEFEKTESKYLIGKNILFNLKCKKCNVKYQKDYKEKTLPWQQRWTEKRGDCDTDPNHSGMAYTKEFYEKHKHEITFKKFRII